VGIHDLSRLDAILGLESGGRKFDRNGGSFETRTRYTKMSETRGCEYFRIGAAAACCANHQR